MIEVFHRPISIMVMFAISLHFTWAVAVFIDSAALNATAISALHVYIPSVPLLITVITTVAVCATIGLFTRTLWVVAFLMPQQILLMMSASGVIEAMWLGEFADLVARPQAFIVADQCYAVWAAIWHTVAIVAHARRIVR